MDTDDINQLWIESQFINHSWIQMTLTSCRKSQFINPFMDKDDLNQLWIESQFINPFMDTDDFNQLWIESQFINPFMDTDDLNQLWIESQFIHHSWIQMTLISCRKSHSLYKFLVYCSRTCNCH